MKAHDPRRADGRARTTNTSGKGADGTPRGLTRRRFLATSAAGASALALGSASTAAQSVAEEGCSEGDVIEVGGGDWHLLNNQWGMPDSEQCIWRDEDGRYGYDFAAAGNGINYPEAFCGGRPWGSDSGIPELPSRRGDIDELVLEWDVDVDISGGEWDLAEEWWLLDGEPTSVGPPITHEVMLVLDWGGGHSHYMEESNVWTDRFGNRIDYWADYSDSGGGTGDAFHIFRIDGGARSGRVDLTEVIDFMSERHGVSDDRTLTGVEVGNEYWQGAQGEVTFNTLDLTVNGTTYESGTRDTSTIEINGYGARDTTGDGLHNDVTGDGETTHEDVTAFFDHLDGDAVQDNADSFDFAGDGGAGFTDVISLFERM